MTTPHLHNIFPALCALAMGLCATPAAAAPPAPPLFSGPLQTEEEIARAIREHYTKRVVRIPMRDGVRLHTHVYVPKDNGRQYPILLARTPYGVHPYGPDNTPTAGVDTRAVLHFAPAPQLMRSGFIFVQQDVRGRLMSEGTFVDIRPVNPRKGPRDTDSAQHRGAPSIDEATDAWDTIEWLVRNVPGNNGRVGVWGGSYLGFYAAQAAIDAHPALKAVSPQAPVTDWFLGDDFHHNGALLLADAALFIGNFSRARPQPTTQFVKVFDPERSDLYDFFLELGPIANLNARFFKNQVPFWDDMMQHPTYDAFWRARDPRPFYRKARPAILTVGGWFDAEDVWGTLETYRAFESQSPGAKNALVIGPWVHNGWMRTDGSSLGPVSFDARTSEYFRERVITPFFLRHLKGEGADLPEATVFETGANQWRSHDAWPPRGARPLALHLCSGGRLASTACPEGTGDSFVSDPAKPVPFTARAVTEGDREYMVEDQRFAARRPDVLVYATAPLTEDLTLAGPLRADLRVTTTGTDADFVVKVIDVYPADVRDPTPNPQRVRLAGYQQLVRGEVMRGRFRDGFDKPAPFVPGQPAAVRFGLPDIYHTFKAGHRLMVQVQSSWFPLVDRNPQTFVDITKARPEDFRPATHTVLHSKDHPSTIQATVLRGGL